MDPQTGDRPTPPELERSISLLEATLESTADGILVVDQDGRIVRYNRVFRELWRIPRDVLSSGNDDDALAFVLDQVKDPEAFIAKVRELYAHPEAESFDVLEFKDGRVFERYSRPQQLDGHTVGRVWSFRDVTARVKAEQEVRESLEQVRRTDEERRRLMDRVVQAHEEERQRIALEIHDDSVQVMTAVGIRLESLRRQLTDDHQREAMGQVQGTVRLAVERLRRLLFELRPPALDREGLVPALRHYLEHTEREFGLCWRLDNGLLTEPPPDTRLALYRIVQEAVTNVRKHAEAGEVVVSLEDREASVLVRVHDDGVGFALPSSTDSPPGHLGLSAMREQAERSGGHLGIESRPGEGTTVEVRVPVPAHEVPHAS